MNFIFKIAERIRIRLHKRYISFSTYYPGFICHVIDKSSFLYMYDEIFTRQIYKFKTERENPFIIDCGANIGLSTIYLKKLYPSAKILAFEPDPEIFSVLKKNLESSKTITGVTCIQACLAKEPGEVTFFSDHADGGSTTSAIENTQAIKVQAVSLQNYLTEPVDFLKIDIEGSEYEVVMSISDKLKDVSNIFIEYHSFAQGEQRLDEILSTLKNAGFRYYLEPGGAHSKNPFINQFVYAGMDMQVNIFGYRKN